MKNENIYIYENFKELLSVIAYLIAHQIKPYNIQKKETVTPNLFTNLIHLDTHLYQQFWDKKLSSKMYSLIKDAYRSEDEYNELVLYYVLLNYQKYGEKVIYMRNLKCVNKLLALAKYVHSETHKWKGFLRFQEMENHFYYAEFEPINDILELIAPHFKTRFQMENWLIKDVKRKKYAFKKGNYLFFLREEDILKLELKQSLKEEEYKDLWKTFFHTIAIKERTNKKCQQNFMPKRYWKYMIEMEDKP